MSLEVVDGKVQFKYDLGSGAVTLTSEKVVSDSAWHQVIIERSLVIMTILRTLLIRQNCTQFHSRMLAITLKQRNENFVIVRYNESHAQACTFISDNRLI